MSMIENGQVHGSCDGETDTLNSLRRAVLTFLEKKEEYKQAIRQAYGDVAAGTFDFELNKAEGLEGTKTFQVSIFRPEIWKLPPEEITELICETCKAYLISPSNVYLGLRPNREADIELEISFNIPRECAKTVGELLTTFNQEGALDWSGMFEHGVNCDVSFIKNHIMIKAKWLTTRKYYMR